MSTTPGIPSSSTLFTCGTGCGLRQAAAFRRRYAAQHGHWNERLEDTVMDEIFDFVIVGNGAGSMVAALVLRGAGKSVLILEKTEYAGGSTAKAGGVMWIPNN